MKRLLIATAASVLVATLMIAHGFTQKTDNVEEFMRAKLVHSQKVIEGLTTENFEMIAKNAQEMSLLSQATTWQVLQTPGYMQRSGEFRRSVDALTEAAKKQNLDGATLAYVDVTLKCVECHKYVRGVRNARLDDERLPQFAPATVQINSPTSAASAR